MLLLLAMELLTFPGTVVLTFCMPPMIPILCWAKPSCSRWIQLLTREHAWNSIGMLGMLIKAIPQV